MQFFLRKCILRCEHACVEVRPRARRGGRRGPRPRDVQPARPRGRPHGARSCLLDPASAESALGVLLRFS